MATNNFGHRKTSYLVREFMRIAAAGAVATVLAAGVTFA